MYIDRLVLLVIWKYTDACFLFSLRNSRSGAIPKVVLPKWAINFHLLLNGQFIFGQNYPNAMTHHMGQWSLSSYWVLFHLLMSWNDKYYRREGWLHFVQQIEFYCSNSDEKFVQISSTCIAQQDSPFQELRKFLGYVSGFPSWKNTFFQTVQT